MIQGLLDLSKIKFHIISQPCHSYTEIMPGIILPQAATLFWTAFVAMALATWTEGHVTYAIIAPTAATHDIFGQSRKKKQLFLYKICLLRNIEEKFVTRN